MKTKHSMSKSRCVHVLHFYTGPRRSRSEHSPASEAGCRKLWQTPLWCTSDIKGDMVSRDWRWLGRLDPTSRQRGQRHCGKYLVLKTKISKWNLSWGSAAVASKFCFFALPSSLGMTSTLGAPEALEVPQTPGPKLTRGISTHRAVLPGPIEASSHTASSNPQAPGEGRIRWSDEICSVRRQVLFLPSSLWSSRCL